jgi:exopolysaccharide production protein ExoY
VNGLALQRAATEAAVRPGIPLGKLIFDKVIALVALILLAPVMAGIAAILWIFERGPVFFAHSRIGQNGERFQCYKFRTMKADGDRRLAWVFEIDPIARADWNTNLKLERDPRVHRIGDFLRRSSLDELPQFWNVLKGDMSIVGPRPIVTAEIEKYGSHFSDFCAVRPGITGAWQVNGRSSTSYEERVALDVDYIRNATLSDDIWIVLKTVVVVLKRDGAC